MELSWFHNLDYEFGRLTQVDLDRSNILLFLYFLKNYIILSFFYGQIMFLFVIWVAFEFIK